MEEANVVRIFTLVFSPGWWHPPAGLSLDCLRHEESPHQPLVVGKGSLGVVGDGRYTGTGVFPKHVGMGPATVSPSNIWQSRLQEWTSIVGTLSL